MTTSESPVVIACAANKAYSVPLAVMLRSTVDHLAPDRRVEIWVIDGGLGNVNKRRLTESLPRRATVHWLAPERSGFEGLPLWGRMPVSTYDKLTVAEALPPELQKVIWLDCDMLVLADVAELWDTPIGDAHLLAVRDALVRNVSSRFGISAFNELGLSPTNPYFNAGMMVIDVEKWRRTGVASAALDYLKRYHDRVFFWDQEALNAVLARNWNPVDDRWNWSANVDRLSRHNSHSGNGTREQQRIVHFTGNIKPWIVREEGDTDASYFRTLDETSWRGWRPRRTIARSMLGWYGSSSVRRALYPAEQVGMRLIWQMTRGKV